MENLGYYNGTIGELKDMTIPMNDRVCWFGDGVYDAGPCRNYKIFAMQDHIDRFYRSAAAVDIQIPVSKAELADLLQNLVKKVDSPDQFVYYQVTRGTAMRDHTYEDGPANLWVMLKPSKIADGKTPIKLITTEDKRFFYCNIKTLNLLPSVMAAQEAKRAGCQEAVFYRPGNRVTECAHSNVHILKDGVLRTAPTDNLILPGIARAHLLNLARKMGVPVVEEAFTLDELFDADEVLVTSSSKLCMHANVIDGKPVAGKDPELLEKLRSAVMNEFESETN